MKPCTECGKEKPLTEFHRNRRMADGHVNQCKECRLPGIRAWNRAHPEKMQAARRRYHMEPQARRKQQQRWRDANPEKMAAHNAVCKALKSGKLVRPEGCSRCESIGDLHAHHADYSKPLEVEWLCRPCHGKQHRIED